MPNSDHPLLEQIAKLRAEAKNLEKQKRKIIKQFAVERQLLEGRVETLVRSPTKWWTRGAARTAIDTAR